MLLAKRQDLEGCSKLMASLSYRSVLERGYAIVHDAAGKPVRSAAATHAGQPVAIEFRDGEVGAVIGNGEAARRKAGRGTGGPDGQGNLF